MQRAHVFDRDQAFAKLLADLKEELSHPELIDAQVGQRGIRHKIDRRAHDGLAHSPDLVDSVFCGHHLLGWSCSDVHLLRAAVRFRDGEEDPDLAFKLSLLLDG